MLGKGMNADERVQEFLRLCENSSFLHKEDLVRGITSGDYELSNYWSSDVPAAQLLNIYRARARYLQKRITSREVEGVHPERLLKDTENFVNELASASDDKVRCWTFSIDGSSSYTVFEGVNASRIFGCLLTVDKRSVSESEWDEL